MKIAILASGGLGLRCLEHLTKSHCPEFIATDKGSEGIIELAEQQGIPLFIGNPRNGMFMNSGIAKQVDVLFSLNYLFLVDNDVLELSQYPINFHGSVLPKYRGRTPHVWAIINNERQAGVTAHLMDENCDTGDIILQQVVEIEEDTTGADLLMRYAGLYPIMLDEIIRQLNNTGKLTVRTQDHSLATYFGKRAPGDGEIDWSWQKERIRNWVRAQASPYPGAFTFLGGHKIVIDKVSFSPIGFQQQQENGLILHSDPKPIVKVPNGAIELTTIREGSEHIVNGQILGR